jgi:hypothetical protein
MNRAILPALKLALNGHGTIVLKRYKKGTGKKYFNPDKGKGGQARKNKKKLTNLKNNTIFNTNKLQTKIKKDRKVSLKTGKSKKMRILSGGNEHGKSKTTLGLTGYRLLSYHLASGRRRTPL